MSQIIDTNNGSPDVMGSIYDMLDDPERLKEAYYTALAIKQQYSDVTDGKWTLNNLAAQWNMMTPEARYAAVALAAIVAYVIVKKV